MPTPQLPTYLTQLASRLGAAPESITIQDFEFRVVCCAEVEWKFGFQARSVLFVSMSALLDWIVSAHSIPSALLLAATVIITSNKKSCLWAFPFFIANLSVVALLFFQFPFAICRS